ncbi:RRM domain-containing protein, partial [Haematococcus lacustris]
MSIKFDPASPAGQHLLKLVFKQVKIIWDPTLKDRAIAQYIVTLASKGYERKKMTSNLIGILGESTGPMLDWLLRHIKSHKKELMASKAVVPAKPSAP